MRPINLIGLAIGSSCLFGCAVGPDFKTPVPASTTGYASEMQPGPTVSIDVSGGGEQRFVLGRDLPGEWWRLFGSTQLSALIERAMMSYPDIAAQQAALRAAHENVRAARGAFFPQLQAQGIGTRQKTGGAPVGSESSTFIENLYQANLNATYSLDLFGGQRRSVEELQAQAHYQNFVLEASYLTLTANVATTAIELVSVREQIAITQEIIALEQQQLTQIQRRFELGSLTRADVLQQQSSIAAERATLPALQQQVAIAEHQLALLTGRSPREMTLIDLTLADLELPQDLPLSLPSTLVAQRPDVKQQEQIMRRYCAAIGVATANMLPQLTLSGSMGNESTSLSNLFSAGAVVWNLTANLAQPIFEGGTLRAKRRAAINLYEQASAQYQLVVLQAFQDVADALTALQNDAESLKAGYDAVNTAKDSLDLVQRQYEAGAVNYVSLLTSQQLYQQARIAYVRALASRYTDTVSLFQALGGGWWNRQDAGTLTRVEPEPARTPTPLF